MYDVLFVFVLWSKLFRACLHICNWNENVELNFDCGVLRGLLNIENSRGAHTNFGIQFLILVELDSLDVGSNPIPDCLSNRNDTFVSFMPSLTFFYFQDHPL